MKKLALLMSTFGTTAAWYILSNKKIRTELGQAKNPEQTVKILKKHLGRDVEKISDELHEFFQSDEFQKAKDLAEGGMSKAKDLAGDSFSKAKEGIGGFLVRFKKKEESVEKPKKKKAK
jgi:hypothetical protein